MSAAHAAGRGDARARGVDAALLELHEDKVPDLEKALAVDLVALVPEDLGARPTRSLRACRIRKSAPLWKREEGGMPMLQKLSERPRRRMRASGRPTTLRHSAAVSSSPSSTDTLSRSYMRVRAAAATTADTYLG